MKDLSLETKGLVAEMKLLEPVSALTRLGVAVLDVSVSVAKAYSANKGVAIPSLFEQPYNLTIPLETLQREQSLRNIEKSGWQELSLLWSALQKWLRNIECAIARAVEPKTPAVRLASLDGELGGQAKL